MEICFIREISSPEVDLRACKDMTRDRGTVPKFWGK